MWPFRKRSIRDELDSRLLRYAERELAARLGVSAPGPGGVRVERFATGRVTHVRRVELEGYGTVVLRVFYRGVQRRRAAGLASLSGLLASHGVRVPRVLFADDSPEVRRLYGFSVLGEEFIEGEAIVGQLPCARSGAVEAAADMLVRLHAIRSPLPGKLWEGEPWSPVQRVRTLARKHLGCLRRLGVGPDRRRCGDLATWFTDHVRSLLRREYPLVHGDFGGNNILASGDGRLWLIDLCSAAYWFPQIDLLTAARGVCGGDGAAVTQLHARYFAASDGEGALSREEYEATRSLFAGWADMVRAARRARRALKHKARGKPTWQGLREEALGFWAEAQEALRAAAAP